MSSISTTILNRRGWLAAVIAALVAVASAGQAQSGRDISKVNGGIDVGAGETVGDLETVNGGVELGEGAHVQSLDSVNGGVRLGERAEVAGNLDSVNGAITLATGARVGGELSNVNGTITLDAARVGGRLSTTNGHLLIGSGSLVEGGILVRKPRGWSFESRPPRVVIGPDAEVRGTLAFEREVRLYVHDRARVGRIEGATPQRYSGAEPPAD